MYIFEKIKLSKLKSKEIKKSLHIYDQYIIKER